MLCLITFHLKGNANQNHKIPLSILTRALLLKDKCWQGCGEIGTLITDGNTQWCSCCRKHYSDFPVKYIIVIWFSNCISGYIHKTIESRGLRIYLYTSVHCSIIHSSQKVDTTQIPNRWMDRQNVLYPYIGILFSHKKEILLHTVSWTNL